ncbi:MAG: DNA methyltransferase [Candidatus Doudnabacteria bacterium]
MKNLQDKKPKNLIKYGSIVELGSHILVCGDSRDKDLVDQALTGKKINLLLTDPPYGVDYTKSKYKFAELSNDTEIIGDEVQSEESYKEFSVGWLQNIAPYFAEHNSIYIFNSDKLIFALKKACDKVQIKLGQMLVWVKNKPVIGRLDYLPQH